MFFLLINASALANCDITQTPSKDIVDYIDKSWAILTRSNKTILASELDEKSPRKTSQKPIVYVSPKEDILAVSRRLRSEMGEDQFKAIRIKYLPDNVADIKQQGLLYLPSPYVVPGSRFNEMYAWDSYFIVLGLLESNNTSLASSIVDNFIYEIEYYGTVLNGNRTYYLTRSQPPFFSHMVLALYEKTKDRSLLKKALPAMLKYHKYWMSNKRFITDIGLNRYYTNGKGPAYEVIKSEIGEDAKNQYQRTIDYYKNSPVHLYDVNKFYNSKTEELTPLFYEGDRAVRASGYDISNRYGPFSVDIIDYASVTLNTLLYVTEQDIAKIYSILENKSQSKVWEKKANFRQVQINKYLWNENIGLYLPYNFKRQISLPYLFADTFFPLWAGLASKEQAKKVAQYLDVLLKPGGLMTSAYFTSQQWDAPFAWAPLQLIAYKGLKNYGFTNQANKVRESFMANVNINFQQTHYIYEKYNALDCSINSKKSIKFGYSKNQIGFGWTNAVYLIFLND